MMPHKNSKKSDRFSESTIASEKSSSFEATSENGKTKTAF